MVDISPFGGIYDGVVVTNNTIAGGFASETAEGSETKGTNNDDVIIKYVYFLATPDVSSELIQDRYRDRPSYLVRQPVWD